MGFRFSVCVVLCLTAASVVSFAAEVDSRVKNKPAATESGTKQYTLQYKFRPNQFVHTEVHFESSMTTQHGDFKQTAADETDMRRHFRVVAVDSQGNATLETTLDHVRMKIQFGDGKPTIFDTKNDISEAGQFVNVWRSVGKPRARYQFSSKGKLISVRLLRAAASQRQKKEDVEVDAKQNFLIVLPKAPVSLGKSWYDDIKVRVTLPENKKLRKTIALRRKYQLEKVEDGIARISLKTIMLTRIGAAQIKAQLIQRTPSGTILFDIERGQIISRESKVDKVVIGALGIPESSMRATSVRREKLVDQAKVAQNR